VNGTEDTAVPLGITLTQEDHDGSETLTSFIMTVPDTVTLSAGTNNNNGTWTLTRAELNNIEVIPNDNFNGLVEFGN
jgi:hypothetical protein